MALDLIPDVVDTCRECRAWQKTDPEITPTLELATQRNDKVEADILYYREYQIWHMIDRADRWHAGKVIQDKHATTLCNAIVSCWYQIYGPFNTLVIDGESGINGKEGKDFLKSLGIQVRVHLASSHE